jgi:small GTP-binding protein
MTSRVVRIVLVGDPAVGKSALVTRLRFDVFESDIPPTLGALFTTVSWINPSDPDESVDFQFWDTAGSERYGSYIPQKLKSANAVLLLFDLSHAPTLESLKEWINIVQQSAPKNAPVFVIGNKLDLAPHTGGSEFAAEHQAKYCEVSAKSGEGLQELLLELAKVPSDPVPVLAAPEPPEEKASSSSCC